MRIAAEHGIDLEQVEGTGRGGRVRKPDVLAYLEGNGGREEEPPMHIESPYKPEPVAPQAEGAPPARGRPAALAHAPVDRQGDDRLAADRGDVHDDHRGRHDPDRARPREDRADLAALRRPRDDRDAARVPSLNATLEGETFTQYDAVNLGIAVSLGRAA